MAELGKKDNRKLPEDTGRITQDITRPPDPKTYGPNDRQRYLQDVAKRAFEFENPPQGPLTAQESADPNSLRLSPTPKGHGRAGAEYAIAQEVKAGLADKYNLEGPVPEDYSGDRPPDGKSFVERALSLTARGMHSTYDPDNSDLIGGLTPQLEELRRDMNLDPEGFKTFLKEIELARISSASQGQLSPPAERRWGE